MTDDDYVTIELDSEGRIIPKSRIEIFMLIGQEIAKRLDLFDIVGEPVDEDELLAELNIYEAMNWFDVK